MSQLVTTKQKSRVESQSIKRAGGVREGGYEQINQEKPPPIYKGRQGKGINGDTK